MTKRERGGKIPSPAKRNSNPTPTVSSQATAQETSSAAQPQPPGMLFGSIVTDLFPTDPNSTPTHDVTSPAKAQETSSAAQPQPPGFQFGSITTDLFPTHRNSTPSPTHNVTTPATAQETSSAATPQETSSAASEKEISARRNSSSSSRSPAQLQPPGITSASLRSGSSRATLRPPQGPSPARRDSPAPTRHVAKPTETTKGASSARGNSSASSSPAQQPPDMSSLQSITNQGVSPSKSWVVKKSSPNRPAATEDEEKSRSSSKSWVEVRKPSPSGPAAAEDKTKSSSVASEDKEKSDSASGGKVAGRYNLRSREKKSTTAGLDSVSGLPPPGRPAATTADPSGSATPSPQHRKSSLAMNDDDRTVQLYLQYLQKHEKPNAITVLLSEEPWKLTINFKKLLKSNRSLAHTICNNKDRLWNSLLRASRTFLLQQFKVLSTRTPIEGISDETIQKGLPGLELVLEYLPSNICTLQDFLDSTTLTALEQILEGHLIIVLTDEGRRILHTLLAYLIAHHKLGQSFGGDWKPKDWDVENSRTVSLSKVPSRFTDASLPAQDLSRLDKTVVPKYLTREHLNIPPNQKPRLIFFHSFRTDLRDISGSLSKEDFHELLTSHPFIMPSEARSDLLFALYRLFKTLGWEDNEDYEFVFGDKGLNDWSKPIRKGNSRALRKIFYHGWDQTRNDLPYDRSLGHVLVYQRHALEHIRNHERLIRKMMELELLVSSRSPNFLARLIRLMFQYKKMVGDMKIRWDMYVGAGLNERI